jgi:Holliday junction resolvase RusA-like endonuclease
MALAKHGAGGKNPYKGLFYKEKRHKNHMATVRKMLEEHSQRPETPLLGPVSLEVLAVWPWLGRHNKTHKAKGFAWKFTKPDSSNWIKGIEDELVKAGYFKDDAQVCELIVRKKHGAFPCISICITEME